MSEHDTTPHVTSIGAYLGIYVVLMALLAITVTLDFILVGALGLVAALGIAVVKALLVLLVFMHLRHSTRLTWVFAGSAFLWLAIMAALTLNDYLSRPLGPYRLLESDRASVQGMYTDPARVGATGVRDVDQAGADLATNDPGRTR